MRSLLYFLIGFALQCVFLLPAYALDCSGFPPSTIYEDYNEPAPSLGSSYVYNGSLYTINNITGYPEQLANGTSENIGSCVLTYYSAYFNRRCYRDYIGKNLYYFKDTRFYFSDVSSCDDTSTNGVQDPGEDGIDCGGSTGVECVSSCPEGYANRDGVCTLYSYIGDDIIWYDDAITYDPIYHSPDYVIDPTTEPWQPSSDSSGMVPIDPSLFVTQEKNTFTGDIIVRDSEGNITGALIVGDSQTTTNSDGTTTTTTTITEHSSSGVVSEKTVSETKDSDGNVIDKKETVTGTPNTVSLYASGKGSTDGVTGDQHAAGVATLVGVIEGEGVTFTAPAESGASGEFETIDESEYDWKASVDSYVEANDEMSWKTYFEGSGITTSGAVCDITGNVTIGSKTVPVSLSLCSFESVFQTLGYLFVTLTQLSALFIVFRGLD